MKKAKTKTTKIDLKSEEHPERLVELESELRSYPTRPDLGVASVKQPVEALAGKDKVVKFLYRDKSYSVGHTDMTYADSNHAHGVRHISFYSQGTVVLCIEGDFEDQQFGSNFKFQKMEFYTPGEWEADFLALTDDLREHKAKRREAFKKKRAKDTTSPERGHSRI